MCPPTVSHPAAVAQIGHSVLVALNPPGQYADDRNLRARQRLWQYQTPLFDIAGWVLDLTRLSPGLRVLDAGCGNGAYLRGQRDRQVRAVGCDLSMGMLRAVSHPALLNADVTALPLRDGAIDVVLANHMLDLVPGRESAIRELRRVLAAGGTCIVVTNSSQHLRSLRGLVERAVRAETPRWQMRAPTHAFTAENAPAQLGAAFEYVTCVRPASNPPVIIRDAAVAAGYVASLASHYQDETARPWDHVVEDVRQQLQAVIDGKGAFITSGDLAALRMPVTRPRRHPRERGERDLAKLLALAPNRSRQLRRRRDALQAPTWSRNVTADPGTGVRYPPFGASWRSARVVVHARENECSVTSRASSECVLKIAGLQPGLPLLADVSAISIGRPVHTQCVIMSRVGNDREQYRTLIDALVRACREGQGQVGPERARRGGWNPEAARRPDDMPSQQKMNVLLAGLGEADREVLAEMLLEAFEGGVHETLVILHEAAVPPFDNGYEGTPFHDFVGRLHGWSWPISQA